MSAEHGPRALNKERSRFFSHRMMDVARHMQSVIYLGAHECLFKNTIHTREHFEVLAECALEYPARLLYVAPPSKSGSGLPRCALRGDIGEDMFITEPQLRLSDIWVHHRYKWLRSARYLFKVRTNGCSSARFASMQEAFVCVQSLIL